MPKPTTPSDSRGTGNEEGGILSSESDGPSKVSSGASDDIVAEQPAPLPLMEIEQTTGVEDV